MPLKWTSEQRLAIEKNDARVMVSASAGSGKTTVMIERILDKIINHNISLLDIAVLTFARTAAADMKDKLKERLFECAKSDENNKLRIINEIELLPMANISTFHSFCSTLIRKNFFRLGVSADFEIINDDEGDAIAFEVLRGIINARGGDARFYSLYNLFILNRTDKPFMQAVLSIYRAAMKECDPLSWLNRAADIYDDPSGLFEAERAKKGEKIRGQQKKLLSLLKTAKENDYLISLKYIQNMLDWLDLVEFKSFSLSTRKAEKEECEFIFGLKSIKSELSSALKEYYAPKNYEQVKKEGEIIKELLEVVKEFYHKFNRAKLDKNVMEYCDLEQGVDALLALNGREEIKHIFVDEYQDISPIQDSIIERLCKEGNAYFVGDVKQSIYGFRLCRPEIFYAKYKKLEEDGEGAIRFNSNYRSRDEILEFCNKVFSGLMTESFGKVDYEREATLVGGLKKRGARVRALFIKRAEGESESDSENENESGVGTSDLGGESERGNGVGASDLGGESGRESEGENGVNFENKENNMAQNECDKVYSVASDLGGEDGLTWAKMQAVLVANEINALLGGSRVGEDGTRIPYRLDDFVVLLRANEPAGVFASVLNSYDIPATAVRAESGGKEIGYLNSLLRLIDNFEQDIRLIEVVKSAIYGFSDEDLMNIRRYGERLIALKGRLSEKGEAALTRENGQGSKSSEAALTRENGLESFKRGNASKEKPSFYQCALAISQIRELERLCGEELLEDDYLAASLVSRLVGVFDDLRRWREYSKFFDMPEFLALVLKETDYFSRVARMNDASAREGALESFLYSIEEGFKGKFLPEYVFALREGTKRGGGADAPNASGTVRIMTIHGAKGLEFNVVFLCGLQAKFTECRRGALGTIIDSEFGVGIDYPSLEERRIERGVVADCLAKRESERAREEELRLLYVALTRAKEQLFLLASNVDERQLESGVEDFKGAYANNYLEWVYRARELCEVEFIEASEIRAAALAREARPMAAANDEECLARLKERIFYKYPFESFLPIKASVTGLSERVVSEGNGVGERTVGERAVGERGAGERGVGERAVGERGVGERGVGEREGEGINKLVAAGEVASFSEDGEVVIETALFDDYAGLENGASAAMIGNAYHSAMQYIDFGAPLAQDEIARMVESGAILQGEAEVLEASKIQAVLDNALFRRLGGKSAMRERRFLLKVDYEKVNELVGERVFNAKRTGGDKLLVQGVIDLVMFDEGGEAILVDFKTTRAGEVELKRRYRGQLGLYAYALERIAKLKVAKKAIYSFHLNKLIEID